MVYIHKECGRDFDWDILWACKSLDKAIDYASRLGEGIEKSALGNGRYFDQLVRNLGWWEPPSDERDRVVVEKARYFPGINVYPEIPTRKYVLYRYPDCETYEGENLSMLGVYSCLRDAITDGWKVGEANSTGSKHALGGGTHFDQEEALDPFSRIGINEIAYDSSSRKRVRGRKNRSI